MNESEHFKMQGYIYIDTLLHVPHSVVSVTQKVRVTLVLTTITTLNLFQIWKNNRGVRDA